MTTKQQPQAKDPWSYISRSQSWKISKMLASTMQFSSNGRTHQANPYHHNRQAGGYDTNQVTRTRSRNTQPCPLPKEWAGRLSQDPTVCLANPHHPGQPRSNPSRPPEGDLTGVLAVSPDRATLRQCSTHEQPSQTRTAWAWPLPPAPTIVPKNVLRRAESATLTLWGLVEMSSLERR